MLSHRNLRLRAPGADPRRPVRPARPAALGPAALPPLRAGPRASSRRSRRGERRLPGQPPADRAPADVPRLQGLDAPHRAAGPPAPRQRDRATGRPGRPAGGVRAAPPRSPAGSRSRLRRLLFRPVLSPVGGRLHTVGVGASAMDVELAKRWMEMGIDVLQGYGATEMGPVVSFTRPGAEPDGDGGRGDPRRRDPHRRGRGDPGPRARTGSPATGRTPRRPRRRSTPRAGTTPATSASSRRTAFLTFRGRKKDMLALPDGQKVYPEDVEAILAPDERLTDAAVVGWPPGPDLRVHAVLLLDDPALAEDVVRAANARLAPAPADPRLTVWPDEDLPRTHTLKVRKPEVLARLPELIAAAVRRRPRRRPRRSTRIGRARRAARRPGRGRHRVGRGRRPSTGSCRRRACRVDLEMDSLQRVELLGRHRGGARGLPRRRRPGPRRDCGRASPRWSMLPAARSASRCAGAGRSARSSAPSGSPSSSLVMYPLCDLFYRVRTTGMERAPRPRRAGPHHPEPLPPPGQRDHPQPPAALGPLEAVGGGRRRDDLRQPGQGRPRLRPGKRVPARPRGLGATQPRAARRSARPGLQHPPLPGGAS